MDYLLQMKEDWEAKALKNVIESFIDYRGVTPKKLGMDWGNGNIKALSANNVQMGFIDFNKECYLGSEELYKRWMRSGDCCKNDIVMTLEAPLGNIAFIPDDKKYILSQRTILLKVAECVDKIFLRFYLMSSRFQKELFESASGSTALGIKRTNLEMLNISFPKSKIEQIRIATILSDMDIEIVALEQQLEKYRKIKQGMMQMLLTGKTRLVAKKEEPQIIPIVTAPEKKHNWQINEAVVIGVLVAKFGTEQFPLYRKRYTKLSYLLHRHKEKVAEGYLKKAAGPYNPKTKYGGPEKIALQNKYVQEHSNGNNSGFIGGSGAAQAEDYFLKWYGQESLDWLAQFRYEKMDELELLATIDMAMEEIKATKASVSLADIKALIQNDKEWKAKLERPIFSDPNIERAMSRLKLLF